MEPLFNVKGLVFMTDEKGISIPLRITRFTNNPFMFPSIEADILSESFLVERSIIKKVIFNDPATIVFWSDGSKTVVKCQEGDTYSEELGLAMCISKKYLGNKDNFNEEFKKWIPEEIIDDDYVGDCGSCKYADKGLYDKPCIECNHNNGNKNNYKEN